VPILAQQLCGYSVCLNVILTDEILLSLFIFQNADDCIFDNVVRIHCFVRICAIYGAV